MFLFLLCLIPLAIPLITKHWFDKDLTWREIGLCCVAPVVLMCSLYAVFSYQETSDVEVLNGAVTSKERNEVHCRHSYDCNCYYTTHRNSNGSYSRTRHCSTCYEHRFDVDWDVLTSIGNYTVDTIDRQGLQEPQRWTIVNTGDPVSKTSSYTNYVRGAKASLFNLEQYKNYSALVPEYPSNIYDMYKINRVIDIGANIPNKAELDTGLSYILSRLGVSKQVNVVLVTTNQPEDFSYGVRNKWLGGKKNDLIINVGMDKSFNITWVKVFGWSANEMVYIKLRDDLKALGTFTNTQGILNVIETDVKNHYQRKHMKDFEYLKSEVEPSTEKLMWALLFCVLLSIGLTVWCVREDVM